MKTLHITVADKIATYLKRDGVIVCANKGEESGYQIVFAFDAEWSAYTKKTARFIWNGKYYDQPFTGNECPVPIISNATEVTVGVYAGDLSTTTPATIPCKKSILCTDARATEGLAKDYVDEALHIIENAGTEAVETVREAADNFAAELGVVQSTGNSETAVMSQKAACDTFARQLKAIVIGETITINDVSPVEHIVSVRVLLSNLFNALAIPTTPANQIWSSNTYISAVSKNSVTISTQSDYVGNGFCNTKTKLKEICPLLEVGKTYVLNATSNATRQLIYLIDSTTEWRFGTSLTITQAMLDSVVVMYGYDASVTHGNCVISNIRVVAEGEKADIDPTTVTVYVGDKQYTAAVDGTVEGVVSVSPTMSFSTDSEGVVLEVEYNKDIEKAVEKQFDDFRNELAEKQSDFANAIKATVTGEEITITDVSPIPHIVGVKVIGGNNYFNTLAISTTTGASANITAVSKGSVTVTTEQSYTGNGFCATNKTLKAMCPYLEVGKTYVLNATSEARQKRFYLITANVIWDFGTSLTITQGMLDSLVIIYGYHGSDKHGACIISNIRVTETGENTDYTPFLDPLAVVITVGGKTYTPNADGTVDGVASVSPTMNFSTNSEDAMLEVKYNKDVGAYVEELVEKQSEDFTNELLEKQSAFANAVKATVTGEEITITDVSPVEHIVDVKLSGGNNYFNTSAIPKPSYVDLVYLSDVSVGALTVTTQTGYTGNGSARTNCTLAEICPHLEVGKTYMLNATTASSKSLFYLSAVAVEWWFGTSLTITQAMLDSEVRVYGFNYSTDGVGNCVISNIRVTEAGKSTEYTPYFEASSVTLTVGDKEYTPNANGMVDGVVSTSPSMSFSTDTEGVIITVTYNRDVAALVNELEETKAEIERLKNPITPVIIDNFQTIDGWSAMTSSNGVSSVTADTENYLYGAQSLCFDNAIQKSGLALDMHGKEFRVKFKVNSAIGNGKLALMITNTPDWSNYGYWTLYNNESKTISAKVRAGEWTELVLPWSGLLNASDIDSLRSCITAMRFRFLGDSGSANIQMLTAQECKEPKGVLSFTFDDGAVTDLTKAAPILGARGMAGTTFIIPSVVGTDAKWLTEEQITSLKYDYNWTIGGHWHEPMGSYTEENLVTAFESVKEWIKEKGLGQCDHFAFANGSAGGVVEKVARRYFTSARLIDYDLIESTTKTNPHRLSAITGVNDATGTSNMNKVFNAITNAALYGGWVILVFHTIGDTTYGCSENALAQIADHAIACGIEVKTISEVLDRR